MSTLPRTKSLSGADTSTLGRNFRQQERNRPSSLCESSWNRIDLSGGAFQDKLKRTPSQANNLCTTVPTSIVNKTLGGRHTPTRNSLRHSRMAVMARSAKGPSTPRWQGESNKMTKFIIFSYISVGTVGCLLAIWFLIWVPFLPIKEVPHYASIAIIVSGFITAIVACLPKHQKRFAKALKLLLLLLLVVSVISCASVCVFDALHLIGLAPMKCQIRENLLIQSAPQEALALETSTTSPDIESFPNRLQTIEKMKVEDNYTYKEDEEGSGGSPGVPTTDDEEGEYPFYEELEIKSTPLSSFEARITQDIYVNISTCTCYRRQQGWRIVKEYPNLTCEDVKNVLPIFLVASCVIMVAGGVLSGVILYILWASRNSVTNSYGLGHPAESMPFIYKSNFSSSYNRSLNNKTPSNGNHSYR